MSDRIRIEVLGYPRERAFDQRWRATVTGPIVCDGFTQFELESLRGRRVRFVENDFPYAVAPGICHNLVWSDIPLGRNEIVHIVDKALGKKKMWLGFVNPSALQSIKTIYHVHVLSTSRTQAGPSTESGCVHLHLPDG